MAQFESSSVGKRLAMSGCLRILLKLILSMSLLEKSKIRKCLGFDGLFCTYMDLSLANDMSLTIYGKYGVYTLVLYVWKC